MEEYYLNNSKCCAKLPTRSSDYLQQSNFLSEFGTKDDKQEARDNLGITGLLDELKSLIDNKIIRYGGVAWDLKPTQGHSDRVLSSDAIYKTLLDYATEKESGGVDMSFLGACAVPHPPLILPKIGRGEENKILTRPK